MTNSLGQILEIKDLIDSKQFSEAGKKLKKLKFNLELKRLFEFQIIVQNKKTKLKKFKITYYDNLKYFEELGKLARQEYSETLLGNYYLARYYEESGQSKKAMRTYQSAYMLEEVGGYTKDDMFERADQIKRDFGY